MKYLDQEDCARALEPLQKAAEYDDIWALFLLGNIYLCGKKDVPEDHIKGVEFMKRVLESPVQDSSVLSMAVLY